MEIGPDMDRDNWHSIRDQKKQVYTALVQTQWSNRQKLSTRDVASKAFAQAAFQEGQSLWAVSGPLGREPPRVHSLGLVGAAVIPSQLHTVVKKQQVKDETVGSELW